jgi:DNA-binding MarR family transcriptional regulator
MAELSNKELQCLPIGRNLAVLSKLYFGVFTKKLEEMELDRYYSIMLMVDAAQCKCTQQYLANHSHIDKTQLVRILDDLIAKGFLTKEQNCQDRREFIIRLTPKSKELLPKIKEATEALNNYCLQGLSEMEKEVFFKAMQTMFDQLSQEPALPVIFNFKKSKKTSR